MAELVPTSRLNQDVMESLPQEVIDGQLSWELSRKAPLVCQQCACLKTRGKVKQKGEKHNGKERARESEGQRAREREDYITSMGGLVLG